MDDHRFDDFAKALATGSSRRRVLKGLAGSAAAGLLSLVGVAGTDAKPKAGRGCKRAGKKCRADAQCCSGTCDPMTGTCVAAAGPADCADVICTAEKFPDPNRGCECVCLPAFVPCGTACCDSDAGCADPATGICGTPT